MAECTRTLVATITLLAKDNPHLSELGRTATVGTLLFHLALSVRLACL